MSLDPWFQFWGPCKPKLVSASSRRADYVGDTKYTPGKHEPAARTALHNRRALDIQLSVTHFMEAPSFPCRLNPGEQFRHIDDIFGSFAKSCDARFDSSGLSRATVLE